MRCVYSALANQMRAWSVRQRSEHENGRFRWHLINFLHKWLIRFTKEDRPSFKNNKVKMHVYLFKTPLKINPRPSSKYPRNAHAQQTCMDPKSFWINFWRVIPCFFSMQKVRGKMCPSCVLTNNIPIGGIFSMALKCEIASTPFASYEQPLFSIRTFYFSAVTMIHFESILWMN